MTIREYEGYRNAVLGILEEHRSNWMCNCGWFNSHYHKNCRNCGVRRPSHSSKTINGKRIGGH